LNSKIFWGIPLFLILAVVAVSGCTGDGLNSLNNNSSQNSSDNNSTSGSSAVKVGNISGADAYVKVSYAGNWAGTIKSYVNGSVETRGNTETFTGGFSSRMDVSGTGNQIYSVMGDLTGIEISISKIDNGTTPLKVQLIKNGDVVKTKTVTKSDGTILLKYGKSVPMI
jgi:hypothetical protein